MFSDVVDELVGLPDAELVALIAANELERRRLDAEMAAALAVAKARNLDGADGHRSMVAFCRTTLNWSTAEAGRRLGLARAVDEVPGLGDAWADGRLGLAQALKLATTNGNRRVSDRLPEFAPQLLLHAEQMPYADFATTVDHFVARADEDGAHDDRDLTTEGRRARVVGVGGTLDLRASGGDGLVTAELIAIHERFTQFEYEHDLDVNRREHGDLADGFSLPRTDRQRRFDALVAIFRIAAGSDRVANPTEPLVNITIDSSTWGRMLVAAGLATATDLDGRPIDPFTGLATDDAEVLLDDLTGSDIRMCETTSGVPLDPHDVLRAALAGHVRRVVVDTERVVIDLGRRQRLFTGSARRAAKLLVGRCEYVGCSLPGDWCDVDHVDEWDRDLGRTDQGNAAVLCRVHNNDKHRRRWRTRRARNGCSYTIRQDGSVILPIGARPPDFDERDLDGDSPADVARLTSLARTRLDDLIRTAPS